MLMPFDFSAVASVLDYDRLIAALGRTHELSEDDARQCVDLYVLFLLLKAAYPNDAVTPPLAADYAWHEHLAAQSYEDDCRLVLGHVLEHNPKVNSEARDAGWERAKELYRRCGVELDGLEMEAARMPANCT